MDKIHMSPTRAFNFSKNPLRALDDYTGKRDWWEGSKDAVLFGSLVHNIAEGREKFTDVSDDDQELMVSKAGKNKGNLKKTYADALVIGQHLHDYAEKFGDAEYEVSINEEAETGQGVQFTATGRADMLTDQAVFDFKTVAPMDFDGFLRYGSFRDGRQEEYKKQISFYALMFGKEEAHILYVKKDAEKPFIYDYQLSKSEIERYAVEMADEIERAVELVNNPTSAKAVNDGSKWAFDYFGGVINE